MHSVVLAAELASMPRIPFSNAKLRARYQTLGTKTEVLGEYPLHRPGACSPTTIACKLHWNMA